jgi:DNA-binding transcriptional LysR family regulator
MNRLIEAEAFVLVVTDGSFTSAARRLGVTRSYASKLVTRLEDQLGIRLLQRSTRKLSLTEPGRAYFERCTEVMKRLEQAEKEATELQVTPRGRLRLTLPTVFGAAHLTRPLAVFKARYPDLVVEAIFSDAHEDLLAEGFDMAIRIGELPDSSLVAQRLASADRTLCASASYLKRRGVPQEPEDLAGHECLRYAYHAAPGTWKMRGPRGPVAIEVSGSLISNHGQMLLEAACQGQGIIFTPVFVTAACLREGRLQPVLPAWRAPLWVHAVFPEARHLSAKVRVLVDFLVEHFRKPPWVD